MEPITEVIFRKERRGKHKGWVTAFFPYELYNYYEWTMECWDIRGGCAGSLEFYRDTVPVSPEEYKELYDELILIGYNLKVIKRINYDRQRLEFRNQK